MVVFGNHICVVKTLNSHNQNPPDLHVVYVLVSSTAFLHVFCHTHAMGEYPGMRGTVQNPVR